MPSAIEEEESEEDEDCQFDHLLPQNWEAIADMRLRQLEKEWQQCQMPVSEPYHYQGLRQVLGIEDKLKQISMMDVKQAANRTSTSEFDEFQSVPSLQEVNSGALSAIYKLPNQELVS